MCVLFLGCSWCVGSVLLLDKCEHVQDCVGPEELPACSTAVVLLAPLLPHSTLSLLHQWGRREHCCCSSQGGGNPAVALIRCPLPGNGCAVQKRRTFESSAALTAAVFTFQRWKVRMTHKLSCKNGGLYGSLTTNHCFCSSLVSLRTN